MKLSIQSNPLVIASLSESHRELLPSMEGLVSFMCMIDTETSHLKQR